MIDTTTKTTTDIDPKDNRHVRFYYFRDGLNLKNLIGCVCLIRTDDEKYFRGISICNTDKGDRFQKSIGRNIAFARACKGLGEFQTRHFSVSGKSEFQILSENLRFKMVENIQANYGPFTNWGDDVIPLWENNVELTMFEKNMWKDHLDPNFVHKPREK